MKKFIRISFLFFLTIFSSEIGVYAQSSVNATVFAEVIAALTASERSQLNFGRFSPETNGGEVLLSPQGGRTANGTVVLVSGTHNSASFYITGDYDASYSIALPTAPVTITNVNNSRTMKVADWESTPPSGIGAGTLRGGAEVVYIGATLKVGTIQDNPTGTYTGTYTITFVYN